MGNWSQTCCKCMNMGERAMSKNQYLRSTLGYSRGHISRASTALGTSRFHSILTRCRHCWKKLYTTMLMAQQS